MANKNNNSENWNPVYSQRSRSSPDQILNIKKRQIHIKDYWLNKPIDTQNQFTPLQVDGEKEDGNKDDLKVSTQKSPPIFVSGVEDIGPLKSLLDNIAENNYTLKTLSNNEVKILPNSSEKYLPIVEELKKKNTQYFTYQRKQDKTYKTVLRNIHPSVDTSDLKTAIEEYGHKIIRLSNIKERLSQKPLPLFFVEIEINSNNKTIFEINNLLNTIVQFEPPRKKRNIPQCMKCQGFGHTKNYCYRSPVCVKCADNHLTQNCPIKEKTQDVNYTNCK